MPADRPTRITLTSPGDLIASIPAALGYVPTESVIAVCLRRAVIQTLGRVDLAALAEPAGLAHFTMTMANTKPDVVQLVVIAAPGGPVPPVPHRDLVDAISTAFANLRLPAKHAVWAPAITEHARWRCYHNPEYTGVLPDPRYTPVAAAGAVAGGIIHPDRDTVAAQIRPDEQAALDRRARLIQTTPPGDGPALLHTAVQAAARGVLPDTDEHIAALAIALTEPDTRERCLPLLVGSLADPAERLWLALTRAVPAPHRAEPAVLLALAAALRGDGVLANLAIDAAVDAEPAHRLARLVHDLLARGPSPDELRAAITSTH